MKKGKKENTSQHGKRKMIEQIESKIDFILKLNEEVLKKEVMDSVINYCDGYLSQSIKERVMMSWDEQNEDFVNNNKKINQLEKDIDVLRNELFLIKRKIKND